MSRRHPIILASIVAAATSNRWWIGRAGAAIMSAASARGGAAPISAPTPQAHAPATMSRRVRPLGGAASAQNALLVCHVGRRMDCMPRLICGAIAVERSRSHYTIFCEENDNEFGTPRHAPTEMREQSGRAQAVDFGVRPEAMFTVRARRKRQDSR